MEIVKAIAYFLVICCIIISIKDKDLGALGVVPAILSVYTIIGIIFFPGEGDIKFLAIILGVFSIILCFILLIIGIKNHCYNIKIVKEKKAALIVYGEIVKYIDNNLTTNGISDYMLGNPEIKASIGIILCSEFVENRNEYNDVIEYYVSEICILRIGEYLLDQLMEKGALSSIEAYDLCSSNPFLKFIDNINAMIDSVLDRFVNEEKVRKEHISTENGKENLYISKLQTGEHIETQEIHCD